MNEELRNKIVTLRNQKFSIRGIARKLEIARNTVKSVLRSVEEERHSGVILPEFRPRKRRASLLDEYDDRIRELLKCKDPSTGREITAWRVLQEIKREGFTGSYTIVKERVRELRPRPTKEPVRRFETKKGMQAQMDYSPYTIHFTEEGPRKVHLFSYILGYSRRRYHRWVESENFTTTIREHINAFNYFGGIAHVCLYDGMKVVVLRYEDDEPIYNPRFLGFCTHYGYRPWACKRGRPKTKGKVERPFYFVEMNLLNGRSFRSLDHLNEFTEWWLANEADVRPNRTTGRPPIELFEEEKDFLLPLPQHPYDTAEVAYRVVNAEGGIHYLGNFYSVPWHYIGSLVPVRVTEDEVIVYSPKIKEITRHAVFPRSEKRKRRVNKAHLPAEDFREKYKHLKKRYQEFGPAGVRYLEGIVEKRRYGKNEALKTLELLGTYHRKDFIAALERAVSYGAFYMGAVERILSVEAAPKSPIEALGEKEAQRLKESFQQDAVGPRPTKEYETLYLDDQEPSDDEKTKDRQQETSGPDH
jgi:transposase